MHRQGFDVQLAKDADRGWRATFIHDRKRALAYQRDGHRVGANSVNYAKAQMNVAFEEYIDLASIEDEQRAVKLSHHPDRLVQFSDPGVRSGQGRPTGMAVQSWPLDHPVAGPSFELVMRGVRGFEAANHPCHDDVALSSTRTAPFCDSRSCFSQSSANGKDSSGWKFGRNLWRCPIQTMDSSWRVQLAISAGTSRVSYWVTAFGAWPPPKGKMPVRRNLDYGRPNIPPVVPTGGPNAK